MSSSHHQSALAFISLLASAFAVLTPTSSPGNDVMITHAFVDIYDTAQSYTPVFATSDGGAVFATYRPGTGTARVVKVDSEARFEWVSEHRLAEDVGGSYVHIPQVITEDEPQGRIYLGGCVGVGAIQYGMIMVYGREDGSFLGSQKYYRSGYYHNIESLLVDSLGNLVFGGEHGCYWIGTIDKRTLVMKDYSLVTSSPCTLLYASHIIESSSTPGNYVLSGQCGGGQYIWVGEVVPSVSTAVWNVLWKAYDLTSPYVKYGQYCPLSALDSGNYAVLVDNDPSSKLYVISSVTHTISASISFPESYAIAASPLLVMGFRTGDSRSFAYEYDPATNRVYDQGQHVQHANVFIRVASSHPSFANRVWAAGFLNASPSYGFIARIERVSPLSCTGAGEIAYLNAGCYLPSTSGCFGLCEQCLLGDNIDACYTVKATLAHQTAVALFAGRCAVSGQYYNSAAGVCQTVMQTSCHPFCGGECLAPSDPTKCAHHCAGPAVVPGIDPSGLANNVCGCNAKTAYNPATLACDACHTLCNGCITGADNTECLDCALTTVPNVVKLCTAAPYTCACGDGTIYSAGMCIYLEGCHPLCLGGCTSKGSSSACVACHITSVATQVSATYSCRCPTGTIYNGTVCAQVIHTDCHPLCGASGCTEAGNQARCLSCLDSANVVSSVSHTYFFNCSCALGTSWVAEEACAYQSGCSGHCAGGCLLLNDSAACIACAAGISPSHEESTTEGMNCECPNGTAYYNRSCVPVLIKTGGSTCSPLCGAAGCVAANDRTKCLGPCSGSVGRLTSSSTPGDDTVACECAAGSRLNLENTACVVDVVCDPICDDCVDSDTCRECPQGEGMVLTEGRCICALGYVLRGKVCVEKSSPAAEAAGYSEYGALHDNSRGRGAILYTVIVSSVIFSGCCGCTIWA